MVGWGRAESSRHLRSITATRGSCSLGRACAGPRVQPTGAEDSHRAHVPRRSRFEPPRAAAEHPKGWNTRRGGTPAGVGLRSVVVVAARFSGVERGALVGLRRAGGAIDGFLWKPRFSFGELSRAGERSSSEDDPAGKSRADGAARSRPDPASRRHHGALTRLGAERRRLRPARQQPDELGRDGARVPPRVDEVAPRCAHPLRQRCGARTWQRARRRDFPAQRRSRRHA
jgi:hypothetical protein